MATCFDIILFWTFYFCWYAIIMICCGRRGVDKTKWCIVLLPVVMAQSFPAWAEEDVLSRATGVVWLV